MSSSHHTCKIRLLRWSLQTSKNDFQYLVCFIDVRNMLLIFHKSTFNWWRLTMGWVERLWKPYSTFKADNANKHSPTQLNKKHLHQQNCPYHTMIMQKCLFLVSTGIPRILLKLGVAAYMGHGWDQLLHVRKFIITSVYWGKQAIVMRMDIISSPLDGRVSV